jgi:hypothetical protein
MTMTTEAVATSKGLNAPSAKPTIGAPSKNKGTCNRVIQGCHHSKRQKQQARTNDDGDESKHVGSPPAHDGPGIPPRIKIVCTALAAKSSAAYPQ